MLPYFSIIVPAYNVEKYIDRTISSVLNQSFHDFELIIIDDCSTDNTLGIITGYERKNKNITVIRHTENQTQHIARMDGVNISKGKYVLFLDGDDSFTKDAFFILFDIIQNNPGYDLYEFGYITQPSQKKIFPSFTGEERFVSYFTRDKYPVQTMWNKVYSSDILKKAFSIMEKICIRQGCEDLYESIVIAYFLKKTINVNEIIVNYTIGSGISTTYKDYNNTLEYLISKKLVISLIKNFLIRTNQNINLDNNIYIILSNTIKLYINTQRNIEDRRKLFLKLSDFFDIKIILEYLSNREESYCQLNTISNSMYFRLRKIILHLLRKLCGSLKIK
jgi:glycosyltransferase involved in cell wall biosynthesis